MTKLKVKPIIVKIQDVVFWFNRNTSVDCAISFGGNRFIINISEVNSILNNIENFSSCDVNIYNTIIEVHVNNVFDDDWDLCIYRAKDITKELKVYYKTNKKELILFFTLIKHLIETTDANGCTIDTHKTKS